MEKIDVKGGQMTYGQRIELGKICDKYAKMDDFKKSKLIKELYFCLHNEMPIISPFTIKSLLSYTKEIIEGITFWVEKEQKLLKYDPTPEELRAGIRDLSEKVADFGTIKALAKTYAQDPDIILEWKYAKVFGLLYTDLEEHKFTVKLNKVISEKYKYGK